MANIIYNQLILHPKDPLYRIRNFNIFANELCRSGFIGDEFIHNKKTYYLRGRRFFDFINCKDIMPRTEIIITPYDLISFQIGKYNNYSYIGIKYYTSINFLRTVNITNPICPKCYYEIYNWEGIIKEWEQDKDSYLWKCPDCLVQNNIYSLDWNDKGRFFSFSIDIYGINEFEAYPNKRIFDLLNRFTKKQWTYFYFSS